MGAFLSLAVEHVDGREVNVDVRPVTIVAFERQYETGISQVLEAPHAEYLYWLAWHSEKIARMVVKPFDEWLADIENVSITKEVTVDAPLDETASPDDSPVSPLTLESTPALS